MLFEVFFYCVNLTGIHFVPFLYCLRDSCHCFFN
ncbi:hypothetical protein NC651_029632 [Populus alba x Populus x berolinensis]|nr:hypothetical protein NC651_029632 [Populus alba x Populus x berolinensis]